jgi:cation/acetate symporter
VENVQESVTAKIRQNPKFQTLVSRRSRFAWTLSAIVLVLFYGFVMVVAFNPAALGASLTGTSRVTVGFAAGLSMFIGFWLLTAYYVRRANTEFDALTKELVEEAWREARQ